MDPVFVNVLLILCRVPFRRLRCDQKEDLKVFETLKVLKPFLFRYRIKVTVPLYTFFRLFVSIR